MRRIWFDVIAGEAAPTIALNTADAYNFGADTTPTLEFTGTDSLSHDLTYEVQISNSSAFTQLIDSYDQANQGNSEPIRGGSSVTEFIGQSFTGVAGVLNHVDFWVSRDSGTTGNCYAELWSHSGTYGTSSVGSLLLATSDAVDVSTFPVGTTVGTSTVQSFTFSGANKVTLAAATNYVIGVRFSGGDASHRARVWTDLSSPTHAGNQVYQVSAPSSAWGSDSTRDIVFSAYLDSIGKLSASDAGFLNTVSGGDTDPFNSGQKISYTVQAGDALAVGTYYWRARTKDPAGTNTWGAWATTRSFSISVTISVVKVQTSVTG